MKARTIFVSAVLGATFVFAGCTAKDAVKATVAPSTAVQTDGSAAKDAGPAAGNDATQGASVIPQSGKSAEEPVVADSSYGTAAAASGAEKKAVQAAGAALATVYFDFDSYLLEAEARDVLSRNAVWFKQNPLVRVVLEGHADERGSDEYNLALSEKRAIAAQKYLESLGVAADRLEVVGYGEEKPAVAAHEESAWSKNRRVEFTGR